MNADAVGPVCAGLVLVLAVLGVRYGLLRRERATWRSWWRRWMR